MAKRGRKPVKAEVKKKNFIGIFVDDEMQRGINDYIEEDGKKHSRSRYIRDLITLGMQAVAPVEIEWEDGSTSVIPLDQLEVRQLSHGHSDAQATDLFYHPESGDDMQLTMLNE